MYLVLVSQLTHNRFLAKHISGLACLSTRPANKNEVHRFELTKQAAAIGSYHGYSAKDAFKPMQVVHSHRWQEKKVQAFMKTGLLLLVSVGLCICGLVYQTISNINYSYRFFPDVSQRHTNSYLHIQGHDVLLPWLQSHSNDLWTLLKLCQSDNRNSRHLGVQAVAKQHSWSDADFHVASQALDARTLIGLARMPETDRRLFLPPPTIPQGQDDFGSQLRQLLSQLPSHDLDICTKYFTSNLLKESSNPSKEERAMTWIFDGNDFIDVEINTSEDDSRKNKMFFLLALNGHSQVFSHRALIVKMGGLEIMRRIYYERPHDIKIVRQIALVIANLSLSQGLLQDMINDGWVTILIGWLHSDDLALRLHATKALANMDRDVTETHLYPDAVYLYHPTCRNRQPLYADVVFIHGLLGGPFRTWRQNDCMRPKEKSNNTRQSTANKEQETATSLGASCPDSVIMEHVQRTRGLLSPRLQATREEKAASYTMCWPQDWLAKDLPHLRILTVDYETHLSEWSAQCPHETNRRSLRSRSRELLEKLRISGVGDRPIIWVAHSMGGLLVKQMLLLAGEDESMSAIVDHSKGIVFYSVPHRGSPLAAYSKHTKFPIYPSVEVKELLQGSKELLRLHESFKSLMFDVGIPLLSFAEGLKTILPLNIKIMMVPAESSDPGFGEYHILKELNHLNICKPKSKDTKLYQLTLEFIRDCIPQHRADHLLHTNFHEDFSE